jgi:acrylyl-CoA reductase (NADPH)
MMNEDKTVRCIMVEEVAGVIAPQICRLPMARFQAGEVTISIAYSSLNFKDSLACSGHRGVIKTLPHIPGIDLAGTVIASQSDKFAAGQQVLVTGYDLGQGHWGGWSEIACVPADWIIKLPPTLSLFEAMFIGTAGFTAAQGLLALQRNLVQPASGPVAVTGASGGVGSIAIRLLAQCGYQVVAVTGKPECTEQLKAIGAAEVISREQLLANDSSRPLLSARWAGAIDTVGGAMLTNLIKSTQYGGCVTACGLVAGHQLEMSVYPFLLRGVSLCGIASADCPMAQRLDIWQRLSSSWKPQHLDVMCTEVVLEQVLECVQKIAQGRVAGRVVINCQP